MMHLHVSDLTKLDKSRARQLLAVPRLAPLPRYAGVGLGRGASRIPGIPASTNDPASNQRPPGSFAWIPGGRYSNPAFPQGWAETQFSPHVKKLYMDHSTAPFTHHHS